MTDDERRTRQPLSMTRRYRRGLILTGLLCALAVLTAATVLFQRSYAERIDNYLMQICHGYAAAYEAQDTHSATTLLNLLPENCPLRITLIDTDGTVLYDTKLGSYIVDVNGDIYAAQTDLPNHADRPEFQQAMANGSACITRESETLQLETHYYAVRIDLPEGAQVLRVGEDVANMGPEHRHPAAAVRRSRADFARCHAVQLVADPPHGAAHQPSGRTSGHD